MIRFSTLVLRTRGWESCLAVRCVSGENDHEPPKTMTSGIVLEILGILSIHSLRCVCVGKQP